MSRPMIPPHQDNLILALSLMVVAAFAPDTAQGRVSQIAILGFVGFVSFQAGVIRQGDFEAFESRYTQHGYRLAFFVGIIWTLFFVFANEIAFQIVCGSIVITCLYITGGVWQRDRRARAQTRSDKP